MWKFIRSFTEVGVTLSMMLNEGKRRTVVGRSGTGWAEWSSGRGMLEAESISFCTDCQWPRVLFLTGVHSYAIARLNLAIFHCFHYTPLLVANLSDPICFAGGNKHMSSPAIDMPI